MEDDNNDMYDNPSSSSYALQQPQFSNSDEFSLFVHQILQRSSSSSCPSATVGHTHTGATPTTQAAAGVFQSTTTTAGGGAVDCFGGYSGCVSASAAAILSSSSVGGLSEYETDENDCQSKEGSEGLTDEMQGKPGSHRGSSKRTRAAEVHNLSEKRRRSRINEKMKALQNLIPNSNKTDKASMLDEAIEYLKQLQLQVQMLYMRNGLSLHSMCLPGVLQPLDISQMRMGLGEENQSLLFQTTVTPPLENPRQNVLGLRNNASLDQPSVPTVRNTVPESLFRPESSSRNNLGPLQLHASAEGVCREDVFCHQPNINQSATHPLGFDRTMTMGNFPSSAPAPDDNITTSMEACFLGRSQSDGVLLDGIQHNDISQHFSRAYPTISRNTSSNGIKAEGRREF